MVMFKKKLLKSMFLFYILKCVCSQMNGIHWCLLKKLWTLVYIYIYTPSHNLPSSCHLATLGVVRSGIFVPVCYYLCYLSLICIIFLLIDFVLFFCVLKELLTLVFHLTDLILCSIDSALYCFWCHRHFSYALTCSLTF